MSDQPKLDRRRFLAGAAGLTGVALSVGAWKPVFAMESAAPAGMQDAIARRPGKFQEIVLKIGESDAGTDLLEAEGGSAFTDVSLAETNSADVIRHIPGNLKWAPVTLKRGITNSPALWNWIKGSISGRPTPESGSIAAADESFTVVSQTDFFNALITEVGFPALDAASKDAAKITIKFQPESTRTSAGSGKIGNFVLHRAWPSKMSLSSFKLTINGLDTNFVTKIDALNFKLNYASPSPDGGIVPLPHLASIDVPNMKITLLEAQSKGFFSWHQDFVINGNNGPENEKTGSLSFLTSDLKTEIFRLDLAGLGIFALEPDPLTLTDSVRHVTAELFCDKMVFNFKL